MIALGLEPEPLAFRVRPQADECFDSWIDRVAAAHEIARPALFRHLGIDETLARQDLARGTSGLGFAEYLRVHHMIEQLAWAVQIAPSIVKGTFLRVAGSAVLPRRLRHYVCARCWQQARRDGRPPIIRKEWILRMSWRCRLHDVPLSRAPVGDGPISDRALDAWLVGALAEAERVRGRLAYRARLIAWNALCIDTLLRGSRKRFKGKQQHYLERFQNNLFHFGRHRVAMLALAHSRGDRAVWGFEQLVAMALPERPGRNRASLQPPKRSPRHWRVGKGRASPRPLEAELLDVVLAYAHLQERRDAQPRVPVQLSRFSAFGPILLKNFYLEMAMVT